MAQQIATGARVVGKLVSSAQQTRHVARVKFATFHSQRHASGHFCKRASSPSLSSSCHQHCRHQISIHQHRKHDVYQWMGGRVARNTWQIVKNIKNTSCFFQGCCYVGHAQLQPKCIGVQKCPITRNSKVVDTESTHIK